MTQVVYLRLVQHRQLREDAALAAAAPQVLVAHARDGTGLLLALLLVHYHVRRLPHAADLVRFHTNGGRLEGRAEE